MALYIVSQSRHNSNSNFLSGDLWPSFSAAKAAGGWITLSTADAETDRWPGHSSDSPPTQHPSTQHSIAASQSPSQQAANQTGHAFIKILLFNGLFSLHEQEVTKPHILVSDPSWLSFSILQYFIMVLTVDGFLFREERDFYFQFSSVCLKQAQCLIFV